MYELGTHLKEKRNNKTRECRNCDALYNLNFSNFFKIDAYSCVCHASPLHILFNLNYLAICFCRPICHAAWMMTPWWTVLSFLLMPSSQP